MKKILLSLAALLSAGSMMAADYVKVTSVPADWSGEYVIAAMSSGQALVWTGVDAGQCRDAVDVDGAIISGDFITVTVEAMTEGYSIKVNGGDNDGKYISSGSSKPTYSNGLKFIDTPTRVDFAINPDGTVAMSQTIEGSGNMYLIYNNNTGTNNERYRFYKQTNYQSSNYLTPCLWKKAESTEYTREVVEESYGTICLPYAVAAEARTGATYYNIAGVVKSGEVVTGVALEEETGALVAGKPYVFKATAATLSATYSGEAVSEAVEATGLVGTLAEEGISLTTEGKYILSNNKLCKLAGGTATIAQNRAYFDLDGVAEYSAAPESHVVFIEVENEGNANGLDAVAASQRQEIYDLTGRRVSAATKGMFIINGKKVVIK